MRLIADTNIFLAVALDEPEKGGIVGLTKGAEIVAPELLPYEIGNALTAMFKRRRLTAEQAMEAFRITENIPVRLLPVDVEGALDIALGFDIYAYDAYFLECARSLSCPLLTLDRRMQEVAAGMGIEIPEVSE